jgi:hypothetical protein
MRWLVAGLIVVTAVLAYAERWRRYKRLAAYHLNEATATARAKSQGTTGENFYLPGYKESAHFYKSEEYERAALNPWISVNPDLAQPDDWPE